MLLYSEHVRYVEQLRRYARRVPGRAGAVLIYDDFRADNEGTVRDVRRFLGVEDSGPVVTLEANPTVRPRSQALNELVHAVGVGRGPVSRAVKQSIKAVTPAGARRRAMYTLKRQAVFGARAPARPGGHAAAARALQGPGRRRRRLPRARSCETVGL